MFGRLGDWCSETYEAAKEKISDGIDLVNEKASDAYDYMEEKVSDGCDYVKTKSAKVWNGITGKDKFLEAEELLQKIQNQYNNAREKYERSIEGISSDIEAKVSNINYHKTQIYETHFTRFKSLGDRLHNLTIKGHSFLEYFDDSIIHVKNMQGVRSKSELYLIDFNNLSFKQKAFGILSLGTTTRKAAKKTLLQVQEEEARVKEEIAKMESQVKKIKVVLKSINNVENYFETLVVNYEKLLNRFEYGIRTQTYKIMLGNNGLINGKLDFKSMPIVHIEEFHALFNLSIVLKQMASLGYLSGSGTLQQHDIRAIKNIRHIVDHAGLIAA